MSEETLYEEAGVHSEETDEGGAASEEKPGMEGDAGIGEEAGKDDSDKGKEAENPEEKTHQEISKSEETDQEAEPLQEKVNLKKDAHKETAETEDTESKDEGDFEEIIDIGEGIGAEEMADLEWNADADQEEKAKPEYFEEEPKKRGFFRRNKEEEYFLRDKWILSRIRDEDLMDYLLLEQKRNEQMQRAKDIREKRLVSAFKLSVSLAAGVAIVYLLKDNPTIFVNILYIGGILGGFHFWKNSQGK